MGTGGSQRSSRASDIPQGQAPVNTKRVYRLMKEHGLLLECRTGRRLLREHDDQMATIHSNCRRARCLRPRHSGRDLREMICDMMVQCVEKRLAASRAPQPVEWLSDNGLIFAADKTIEIALALNLALHPAKRRFHQTRHRQWLVPRTAAKRVRGAHDLTATAEIESRSMTLRNAVFARGPAGSPRRRAAPAATSRSFRRRRRPLLWIRNRRRCRHHGHCAASAWHDAR
jgi:hypothetical protein